MKKLLLFIALSMAIIALLPQEAQAQRGKKGSNVDKYFDEGNGLANRLWYGGMFNLGFNGNGLYNVFNIGASPMVGYKLIETVSIGPRISYQYSTIRGYTNNPAVPIQRTSLHSYSAGLFARYKFFPQIFAQVEYAYSSQEFPLVNFQGLLIWDNDNLDVATVRETRDNFFAGLGFNNGRGFGTLGYEILILYNFLEPANSIDLPIDLRIGITYNF